MVTDNETAPDPGRTVLITGTSSGIGLATAVAAAAAGWRTVATLRDAGSAARLQEAAAKAGVTVDIRQLDVTDPASIEAALRDTVAEYGRLDAVVNNAGAAKVGTLETLNVADFRDALEVNFFSVVQVSRLAMPHLRRSGGRLVAVSSVGGAVGQPFNEAYCAAKFAVEGFLQSLAPVAETVGVRVTLVEPGAVGSDFIANAGLDPQAALESAGAYAPALQHYLDRTMRQFSPASVQSPAEVGQIIADLLDAADPPLRVQTSDAARDFVGTSLRDLDGSAVLAMTREWVG